MLVGESRRATQRAAFRTTIERKSVYNAPKCSMAESLLVTPAKTRPTGDGPALLGLCVDSLHDVLKDSSTPLCVHFDTDPPVGGQLARATSTLALRAPWHCNVHRGTDYRRIA